MDDLFSFPRAASKPSMHNIRRSLALVPDSEIVTITNKAGKTVRYVRLSDDEHAQALRTIRKLYSLRGQLKEVYDLTTSIWGERNRRYQTYGELIDGLQEKCQRSHPIHKSRIGEDFGVRQLHVLNELSEVLNAAVDGSGNPMFQDDEGRPLFSIIQIPFEN